MTYTKDFVDNITNYLNSKSVMEIHKQENMGLFKKQFDFYLEKCIININ